MSHQFDLEDFTSAQEVEDFLWWFVKYDLTYDDTSPEYKHTLNTRVAALSDSAKATLKRVFQTVDEGKHDD